MTENELSKICNLSKSIYVLKGLTDRDKIPVEIAIREGNNYKVEPTKLYPLFDLQDLSEEIRLKIREILDRAGDEVKRYLNQELAKLQEKFSKIEVNENP